jgi:hypothetical protein
MSMVFAVQFVALYGQLAGDMDMSFRDFSKGFGMFNLQFAPPSFLRSSSAARRRLGNDEEASGTEAMLQHLDISGQDFFIGNLFGIVILVIIVFPIIFVVGPVLKARGDKRRKVAIEASDSDPTVEVPPPYTLPTPLNPRKVAIVLLLGLYGGVTQSSLVCITDPDAHIAARFVAAVVFIVYPVGFLVAVMCTLMAQTRPDMRVLHKMCTKWSQNVHKKNGMEKYLKKHGHAATQIWLQEPSHDMPGSCYSYGTRLGCMPSGLDPTSIEFRQQPKSLVSKVLCLGNQGSWLPVSDLRKRALVDGVTAEALNELEDAAAAENSNPRDRIIELVVHHHENIDITGLDARQHPLQLARAAVTESRDANFVDGANSSNANFIAMTEEYEKQKEALKQELLAYDEPEAAEGFLLIYGGLFTKYKPIGILFMAADGLKKLLSMIIMAVLVGGQQLFFLQAVAWIYFAVLVAAAPHNDGLKNLSEPVVVAMQLAVVALPSFAMLGWIESTTAGALMFTSQMIGIPTAILKEMSAMVPGIIGGVTVMILDRKQDRQSRKATRTVESDFDSPDDYAENPVAANASPNSGGLALASNREPSADLEK